MTTKAWKITQHTELMQQALAGSSSGCACHDSCNDNQVIYLLS